jgi:hypothetical protein
MPESERLCPKCGAAMQEGFIPVSIGVGAPVPSLWVEGHPEKGWLSRLGGGVKFADRKQLQIHSYRGSACGYLEEYATHS